MSTTIPQQCICQPQQPVSVQPQQPVPQQPVQSVPQQPQPPQQPQQPQSQPQPVQSQPLPHDSLYALDKPGNIYKCDAPCNGAWKQIGGNLSTIASDKTSVYGTNASGDIYTCKKPCDGSNWKQIPGKMSNISSDNEYLYGTNATGESYKCKIPCGEGGNTMQIIPSSQQLAAITGNEHFSNEHFTTGIAYVDSYSSCIQIIIVLIIGLVIYWLYVNKKFGSN